MVRRSTGQQHPTGLQQQKPTGLQQQKQQQKLQQKQQPQDLQQWLRRLWLLPLAEILKGWCNNSTQDHKSLHSCCRPPHHGM